MAITRTSYLYACLLGVACATLLSPAHVSATIVDDPCQPIEFMFARGSGGTKDEPRDDAANTFHDSIVNSLKNLDINYHEYYLGSESYDGHQYPHVPISGSFGSDTTALGAKLSNGDKLLYGKSVNEGVGELKAYLTHRESKCPTSRYIVGGFSQGAQVVGDTLFKLSDEQLDKIAYVGLFGDPKLNLPEGQSFTHEGITDSNSWYAPSEEISPDACYGLNPSMWRRMVDNCRAYSGQLGGRKPYVPDVMKLKVHTWCHLDDSICDNTQNPFGDNKGHNYTDQLGIPAAVDEALFSGDIVPSGSLIDLSSPAAKYDISFITPMRCTPLFRFTYPIPQLRVPYDLAYISDHNPTKLWRLSEMFSDGLDTESRANMLQYLNSTRRPGSQLILYYVDIHSCDDIYTGYDGYSSGLYSRKVMKSKALTTQTLTDTQPWSDPIIISEITDDPTICESTSNTCRMISPDTANLSLSMLGITEQPQIIPLVNSYASTVQHPTTYTVKTASDANPYTTYQWDFNADGQSDMTTTAPSVQYAYDQPYDGDITVTASGDTTVKPSSTTIHQVVTASASTSPRPLAPQYVTLKKTTNNELIASWQPSGSAPGGWMIRIDDFPMGYVVESQHSIIITDMDFSRPITVSIAGLTSDKRPGVATSATIEPGVTNNNPDLSRVGDDISKLVTAYELGNPVPDRVIPLPPEQLYTDNTSQTNLNSVRSQSPVSETTKKPVPTYLYIVSGAILFTGIIIGATTIIRRVGRK